MCRRKYTAVSVLALEEIDDRPDRTVACEVGLQLVEFCCQPFCSWLGACHVGGTLPLTPAAVFLFFASVRFFVRTQCDYFFGQTLTRFLIHIILFFFFCPLCGCLASVTSTAALPSFAGVCAGGTMGLAFSRLWDRMFGKKEMRILMVSAVQPYP